MDRFTDQQCVLHTNILHLLPPIIYYTGSIQSVQDQGDRQEGGRTLLRRAYNLIGKIKQK